MFHSDTHGAAIAAFLVLSGGSGWEQALPWGYLHCWASSSGTNTTSIWILQRERCLPTAVSIHFCT